MKSVITGPAIVARYARAPRGMNGLFDSINPFGGSSAEKACLDRANASPQVRLIDQQVDALGRSWKPTGYYRPAELAQLLATLEHEAAAAGAALAAAPRSTSDAQHVINQAFADLKRRYQERSFAYKKALAQAQASGANVIDGPGVKDWVIASMRAISDAYVTATVLSCMQSWAEAALNRAYQAMVAIGGVAARIVGVVVKVGDTVLKAADDILDLYPIIKWGAVGIGALFAFKLVRERWRR